MYHRINIAVECAQLITGDGGYLDFLRSQIRLQVDNGRKREDGQLLVPVRYGPDGWDWNPAPGRHTSDGIDIRGYWLEPTPLRGQDIMHLYHASMDEQDYQLITQVRDGDVGRDWNDLGGLGEKNWGQTEFARFQYYDGRNPVWPEQILAAEYQHALETYETRHWERPSRSTTAVYCAPPCATSTGTGIVRGCRWTWRPWWMNSDWTKWASSWSTPITMRHAGSSCRPGPLVNTSSPGSCTTRRARRV